MGRDTATDDPALRLARGAAQLFSWFELHRANVADELHRASAHLLCHDGSDDAGHAQAARALLQRLLAHELPDALGLRARLGTLFLQANEVLGDRVFVDAAFSVAEGIVDGARDARGGTLHGGPQVGRLNAAHHANLQAAALLARLGRRFGERTFLELAQRAVGFSLAHQREDGGWLHAQTPQMRWVDHLHAGTRVASLLALAGAGAHPAVYAGLARALRHLVGLHFDEAGSLRTPEDPPSEADVRVAAGALDALAQVAEVEPGAARGAAARAGRLADWVSAHLGPWSLWREPSGAPGAQGPGVVLEALVRAQALRGVPLAVPLGSEVWAAAAGSLH
ncbi:MAG: hypothetical protein RI988_625 [Pseudomonadota bacterium]